MLNLLDVNAKLLEIHTINIGYTAHSSSIRPKLDHYTVQFNVLRHAMCHTPANAKPIGLQEQIHLNQFAQSIRFHTGFIIHYLFLLLRIIVEFYQ